jgi:hypothetical protein
MDVAKPMSRGVTPQQEYIILGYGLREETDNFLLIPMVPTRTTMRLNETSVKNPSRITCGGGRFIFAVKGDQTFVVYQIKDTGLQRIKTCSLLNTDYLTDSATTWDSTSFRQQSLPREISTCFGMALSVQIRLIRTCKDNGVTDMKSRQFLQKRVTL